MQSSVVRIILRDRIVRLVLLKVSNEWQRQLKQSNTLT
jgi:hypothetical protein